MTNDDRASARLAATGVAVLIFLALTPSPAAAKDWNAVKRIDPFTDIQSCRVEPGGAGSRAFFRGRSLAYYFYAEKRGDQIRAGVFSEPAIPIAGDVQIRVDDGPLITITAADTPIDAAPAPVVQLPSTLPPEARAAYEQMIAAAQASASPYRAVTGERAAALLHQILAGKLVRIRSIGINSALSTTGEIKIDPRDLRDALEKCEILPSA